MRWHYSLTVSLPVNRFPHKLESNIPNNILSVVKSDPNIYLWIAASVTDAAALNLFSIKTVLANGLSTFLIKVSPVFSNCSKILPKNHPNCLILCNWFFDNFILAQEVFAKALQSFETCVLVKNNLCAKLVWSLGSQ